MPFPDLRAFLSTLKEAGELVDVNRPVALKYDVAKALAKTSSLDGPALMFQQTGTDFPLVAGLYEIAGGLSLLLSRPKVPSTTA